MSKALSKPYKTLYTIMWEGDLIPITSMSQRICQNIMENWMGIKESVLFKKIVFFEKGVGS